jgi:hypothetical protein
MKFASFFLIVILSLLLQFQFRAAFHWSPEFILASLIVIAFFAGLPELLFLTVFAGWMLNWEPGLAPELALFLLMPIIAHLFRRLLPWEPWVTLLFVLAIAEAALAGLTSASVFRTPLFYGVLASTLVYGAGVFLLFYGVFGYPWAANKRIFL